MKCPQCDGAGEIIVRVGLPGDDPIGRAETCDACGGSGDGAHDDGHHDVVAELCATCDGGGWLHDGVPLTCLEAPHPARAPGYVPCVKCSPCPDCGPVHRCGPGVRPTEAAAGVLARLASLLDRAAGLLDVGDELARRLEDRAGRGDVNLYREDLAAVDAWRAGRKVPPPELAQ